MSVPDTISPKPPLPDTGSPEATARYPWGVSVIICCHNSAGRLAPTLEHLLKQRDAPGLPWEVIVVDNASSDHTAATARSLWPESHPRPLKVVQEDKLGLTHARVKGLSEARYECISFVDDDNWVCPEWVQTVAETFETHPEVGMLSGRGEGVFEATPPPWFYKHQRAYVVGGVSHSAGVIAPADAYGAGMCLRRSVWDALRRIGFRFILDDRRGLALTSGGDVELMVSMSFMGWQAWYEPRLCYKHWIPRGRLTTAYIRRLYRGFGMASTVLGIYLSAGTPKARTILGYVQSSWLWRVLRNVRTLFAALLSYFVRVRRDGAFEPVLSIEWAIGAVVAVALTGPVRYQKRQKSVHRLYDTCKGLKQLWAP
ncbi:MAG: glycosyltransferase [Terriglobia bacterium]|jgi:glycosyltransferase involved in cell wall biosynthesis